MNKTIESFERTFDESEELKIFAAWREKQYSYYSGYVHNNFIDCLINARSLPEKGEDVLPLNIWGFNITRIEHVLGMLNDLMFWTCLMFYRLIQEKIVSKEQLVEKKSADNWGEAVIIGFMANALHMEYKAENELD